MQYNQLTHANKKQQKIILKPRPSLKLQHNEAKKNKNINISVGNHSEQKDNSKKQMKSSLDKKIFDTSSNNFNKELEGILKHKLTITGYPDLGTDQSRNFINKLARHKKLFNKNGKKDQIKQSGGESDFRKTIICLQRIKNNRNKIDNQHEQLFSQKVTAVNTSRSLANKKIEQQPYLQKTCYSNMFRSQTTSLNRKRKVKILIKVSQNKPSIKNVKSQNKFQIKSINPLPKKNPILQQNKHYHIYKSASGLYDSIQRAPKQFLKQYLKHKKQRYTPELKEKNLINLSQQQQKILLQIRQYVQKNYNKDQFCNYYSAHLNTQNEYRIKLRSRNNDKKKRQRLVVAQQDLQGIDAWKQINNNNELQNKITGLRGQHMQVEQDQIVQFMRRQKF